MPLYGVWYNELGSTMELQAGDTGMLSGVYETAVGSAARKYQLVGSADVASVESASLAFSVTWANANGNSHSSTAWCGQYQVTDAGQEIITTTWLLTSETAVGDDWESTLVGEDVFTRDKPSAANVAKRMLRAASHPGVKRSPR